MVTKAAEPKRIRHKPAKLIELRLKYNLSTKILSIATELPESAIVNILQKVGIHER